MDHRDHVALLRAAVEPGGSWADIGAGEGAFTLALADLLGPGGRIVAIDRDRGALERNEEAVRRALPGRRADHGRGRLHPAVAAGHRRARRAGRGQQPPLRAARRAGRRRPRCSRRTCGRAAGSSSSSTTRTTATRGSRIRSAPDPGRGWRPTPGSWTPGRSVACRAASSARSTRRLPAGRDADAGQPARPARPDPSSRRSQSPPRRSRSWSAHGCRPATDRRPSPRARRCPWLDDRPNDDPPTTPIKGEPIGMA